MTRGPIVTDVVVVGGGFFGTYLAHYLAQSGRSVMLFERAPAIFSRASYGNQARIHHGYHYPRHILTALRSRVNYPRFVSEFPEVVDASFEKLYAIGRRFSKVTAEEFRIFMQRIGAPIERASKADRALFDDHYVEEVFRVQETAFDALRLRDVMERRCAGAGVRMRTATEVTRLSARGDEVAVEFVGADSPVLARDVFICTYSRINVLLSASALPLVPLKHELTEMCLVGVPPALEKRGITVMCGPFFSCMPFPPLGLHTLSHVRYTPHYAWHDDRSLTYDAAQQLDAPRPRSRFPEMSRDAARYVPALRGAVYRDSIWEVKTLLPRSERDDGRPILFRRDQGIRGVHVILGGKIDNVYDAVEEVSAMMERREVSQ